MRSCTRTTTCSSASGGRISKTSYFLNSTSSGLGGPHEGSRSRDRPSVPAGRGAARTPNPSCLVETLAGGYDTNERGQPARYSVERQRRGGDLLEERLEQIH